jgi:putative transcriptional regulator
MIRYKIDILSTLKEIGYSTYKIKQEKIFNQSQLQQIRDHKLLTQEALNKVCTLLNCQPGDILEYIPDPPIKNENN